MPNDLLTSIPLVLATLASCVAFVLAARGFRRSGQDRPSLWPMCLLLSLVTLLNLGAFIHRIFVVHQAWQPTQTQVDGLLLLSILLAPSILYIQARPRLFGLSLFMLPLLTMILVWGLCAALWIDRPFKQDSFEPAWVVFHTTTTYLGLFGCGLGAASGAMYLFVQGRLKSKAGLGQIRSMASLETLETLIVRAATLGFVLLTLSLVSGFIMVTQSDRATSLGESWWGSPKVWLAAMAWCVYALLINVRAISLFRGRRAAWLAIAGLFLVLATYGAVEVIDRSQAVDAPLHAEPAGGGR